MLITKDLTKAMLLLYINDLFKIFYVLNLMLKNYIRFWEILVYYMLFLLFDRLFILVFYTKVTCFYIFSHLYTLCQTTVLR